MPRVFRKVPPGGYGIVRLPAVPGRKRRAGPGLGFLPGMVPCTIIRDGAVTSEDGMATWMETRPQYRRLLTDNELDSFENVMGWRGGQVRSKHRIRNTVRMLLFDGDEPVIAFLKRNYKVPAKHVVLDWLRGRSAVGQPIKEAAAIKMLEDRGIGVMESMAFGQRSRVGWPTESFILVKAVPATDNIEDWLRKLDPWRSDAAGLTRRRALLYQLGELVWRIQRSSVSMPDLVAKHIHARDDSAPEGDTGIRPRHADVRFRFYLIDVERAGESDDVQKLRGQLKTLIRSMVRAGITGSDLMRFVRGYLDSVARDDRRAFRVLLEEEFAWAEGLARRLRAQLRSAGRRPDELPNPADDQYIRFGRMVVNKAFVSALQHNGLMGMADAFSFSRGVRLDKPGLGHRERIRAVLDDPEGGQKILFLKRYNRPPLRAQIRRVAAGMVWHGTAWREFQAIKALSAGGIPTMRLVAVGERMQGPIERRSFVATEGVPGESLEQWIPRNLGAPDPSLGARRRHEATRRLARLVQQMHSLGVCHRDLYLSHVFVVPCGDGSLTFRFIDLQRVHRFAAWRRRRWLVKDLAALHYSSPSGTITVTDRIRFLREYLDLPRLGRDGRKWMLQVRRKAERMARHNRPA